MKLDVKDEQIWDFFVEKVKEDDWYMSFKESHRAIMGFTALSSVKHQKVVDDIYERVERVCGISIWEENMTVFRDIVNFLILI